MKRLIPLIFCCVSVSISAHAWQDSFEEPLAGWEGSDSSSLALVSVSDGAPSAAVTDGTQALELTGKKGHNWNQLFTNPDLGAVIKKSTTVSMDIYVPQSSLPASGWAKVQLRLYGGKDAGATFDITKEIELDLYAEGGKSYQINWDYAAEPQYKDDFYWAHLGLVSIASGGSMSPIYVDNVEFTDSSEIAPELATDQFLLDDSWSLVWQDEFEGAKGDSPAAHWLPGALWNRDGTWRDSTLAPEEAFLDGKGNLVMQTRFVDGERLAPYLVTSEDGSYDASESIMFGPGENGIYIEWRANVSQFKAQAAWFALWLFSDNPYEGDAELGSEIDVMEYVPYEGSNYSMMDKFNAAIHIEDGGVSAKPPTPYGLTEFDENVWHTWGLYWTKDIQVFYLDGKPFWINQDTKYISSDDTHGLRMTIEIANGDPAKGDKNHWGHAVGRFEDNPTDVFPAKAFIDYVRVYRKNAN
tara:strand:+ start:7002 stop:8408 length:1407 start_codon:yes stop_codon:yes gene_type:complete